MKDFFSFITGAAMLILVVYGILYFLDIQPGNLNDWIVGVGSFFWLVTITTVPWNAHFKAKEVLDDAEISKRKDILVIDSSLAYVKKVAKRSLWLAVALHIISAIGLFFLAQMGFSIIGYFAAGLAIALTFLRPTVRFYEYLRIRLENIKKEFRYPREDLQSLLHRTKELEVALDTKEHAPSWRNEVTATFKSIEEQLKSINEQLAKNQEENQTADAQLATRIEQVAQSHNAQLDKITTDSKVLDAVRELAGFVKKL